MSQPLYRLIDISPDLAVCPCPGMIVKRVGEDQCALFTPGQDATSGGFLIDRPWDEVVFEINEEIERAIDEASSEDDEDEPEDVK